MKRQNTAQHRLYLLGGLALLCLACLRIAAEQLPIKAYSIADGLADNSINRIVKDSHGFLWFCTSEGLARFEGYRFVNYGMEHGLAGRYVSDQLETRGGVYWVGTNRGLYRFNYQPMASGKSAPLFSELRLSAVWFGTTQGMSRLNPQPDQPATSPPIKIGELEIAGVARALSVLGETAIAGLELEPNQNDLRIGFFSLNFAAGESLRYQIKLVNLAGAEDEAAALGGTFEIVSDLGQGTTVRLSVPLSG